MAGRNLRGFLGYFTLCDSSRNLSINPMNNNFIKDKQKNKDWKSIVKKNIYKQNFKGIQSIENNIIHQYHQEVKEDTWIDLEMDFQPFQDEELSEADFHSSTSTYFNVANSIQSHSGLQIIIPSAKDEKVKKQIEKDIIHFQQWAMQQQDDVQGTIWQFLIQKYTCPLDILQRISIYSEMIKYGTEQISAYINIYCPSIKPSFFFNSILLARKYIEPFQKIYKGTQRIFCGICSKYCCNRHEIEDKDRVNQLGKRNSRHIFGFLQLMEDMKMQFFQEYALQQKQICKNSCYRTLQRGHIINLNSKFQPFQSRVVEDMKKIIDIFGYSPCAIAKNMNLQCSQVAIYLLNSRSLNSTVGKMGLSQSQYLKSIMKQDEQKVTRGCLCLKGQCKTDKCFCFKNNRECDPLYCGKCYQDSLKKKNKNQCLNRSVSLKQLPNLKIGFSKQTKTLNLYTMNSIKEGQVVCQVKGQVMSPMDIYIRNAIVSQDRRKVMNLCQNMDSSRISGKQRFIRQVAPVYSNLQKQEKIIEGKKHTILISTRDIREQQQLTI